MGWEGELVPSDQSISPARQNVKYNLQNVGNAGLRFAGNRGMIALKKKEELLTGGIPCGRKEPKLFYFYES